MTYAHSKPRLAQTLRACVLATVLTATNGGLNAALAHSFNMFMVLPETGVDDQIRRDMMQAFLIATKERDSHPNEDSNGHLGGLDVYVTFADVTEAAAIAAANPDIIATPLGGVAMPDYAFATLLGTPDLDSKTTRSLLATPANASLAPFRVRFQTRTGRLPGAGAKAVYVTARLISDAVRRAGGVDDTALLRRLLNP